MTHGARHAKSWRNIEMGRVGAGEVAKDSAAETRNGTSHARFKLSAQNTFSRLFIPGMDLDFGSFVFVNLSHSF